ncbi:hypothetical protein Trydic_g8574 [Trypoxylus dichotomus]
MIKAGNKMLDMAKNSQNESRNGEQNGGCEILKMLKELNCNECDENDVQQWMDDDDADLGQLIMGDNEIVDLVIDKADATSISSISVSKNEDGNIPAASEAFTCFHTASLWYVINTLG